MYSVCVIIYANKDYYYYYYYWFMSGNKVLLLNCESMPHSNATPYLNDNSVYSITRINII